MASNQTPNTVTANEARLQFSDILNRAIYVNQPTIVTRSGKPSVVLISYPEWQKLLQEKGLPIPQETGPEGDTSNL